MAERAAPWRSKPSQDVVELLQRVGAVQLFLVQRPGPTSFVVREEGSEVKRKVQIGSRITCSCSPVGPNGTCKELCLHTLFVMVKVLRVPVGNPLLWQLSLSDRELEEVLRCAMQPERPPPEPKTRAAAADKTPAGQVKRKEVDEDDPCPICYEDMVGQDPDLLVWCRFGCGRNVHGKCMGVWMEHQVQSLGKELTCPLCRSEWGDFKWKPPPPKRKAREERKDVHYGTHCGACKKAPLVGKRYRCLICADFDLCEGCFSGGHHPQHPFAVKDTPKSFGAPAERPDMMPTATRIGGPLASMLAGSMAAAAGVSGAAIGGGGGGERGGHHSRSHSSSGQAPPEAPARRESDVGEGELVVSAAGVAPAGVAAAGVGDGGGGLREALAVGVAAAATGQHAAPRVGGGPAAPAASRHPIRGTTVARAGAGGRGGGGGPLPQAGGEDASAAAPPALEARLAQRRQTLQQQQLAVAGLTVGPASGAAGGGGGGGGVMPSVGFTEATDVMVRRANLGQPSKPVLVRRARSTAHERLQQQQQQQQQDGVGAGELSFGLAGVQLGSDAAGPGPSTAAATMGRQQGAHAMPPRHPGRPGMMGPGLGPSQLGRQQPGAGGGAGPGAGGGGGGGGPAGRPPLAHHGHSHHGSVAGVDGPGASTSPELVLQGRVLHGDSTVSPGAAGAGGGGAGPAAARPPPQGQQLAHGRAGLMEPGALGPLHSIYAQQLAVGGAAGGGAGGGNGGPTQPGGVRFRGLAPRYGADAPAVTQAGAAAQHAPGPAGHPGGPTGLRRSRSAGHHGPGGLGLTVTARSMAPHPLTPPTPMDVALPMAAAAAAGGAAGRATMPRLGATGAALTYSGAAGGHNGAGAGNSLYGQGPYGAAPYGNETYGGAIIGDDQRTMLAFSHHIPGPGASFRDGGYGYSDEGAEVGEAEELRAEAAAAEAAGHAAAAALWGRDVYEDEFPRGPRSPHLHLFSSRPNTTGMTSGEHGYGGSGAGGAGGDSFDRSYSHSHSQSFSYSHSQSFGSPSPSRRHHHVPLPLDHGSGSHLATHPEEVAASSPGSGFEGFDSFGRGAGGGTGAGGSGGGGSGSLPPPIDAGPSPRLTLLVGHSHNSPTAAAGAAALAAGLSSPGPPYSPGGPSPRPASSALAAATSPTVAISPVAARGLGGQGTTYSTATASAAAAAAATAATSPSAAAAAPTDRHRSFAGAVHDADADAEADAASQRDSVLMASVQADAMDDFINSLRRTHALPSFGSSSRAGSAMGSGFAGGLAAGLGGDGEVAAAAAAGVGGGGHSIGSRSLVRHASHTESHSPYAAAMSGGGGGGGLSGRAQAAHSARLGQLRPASSGLGITGAEVLGGARSGPGLGLGLGAGAGAGADGAGGGGGGGNSWSGSATAGATGPGPRGSSRSFVGVSPLMLDSGHRTASASGIHGRRGHLGAAAARGGGGGGGGLPGFAGLDDEVGLASSSLDDTLSSFMVERKRSEAVAVAVAHVGNVPGGAVARTRSTLGPGGGQGSPGPGGGGGGGGGLTVGADGGLELKFTTIASNPVFNRPYTLDMSLG
ncbi:hypothetical protein HYH02_012994 [Chlamydomonas schloesseri]|uniref:Uncharacterized protein n=1 Tax=Chlamydomonas schloesseri TaxID=2026947 RepID=A0A835SYL6_9CHLO|nr:hypothetical protein HYH02_012994 [Chlamydomonas schloesseri]|eukprot:KAG2432423.1 hypothetical protein HYH02_012994 [Chlamydomonas schloesseri]